MTKTSGLSSFYWSNLYSCSRRAG